jgi:electron transfer flavoprotein beta subunit
MSLKIICLVKQVPDTTEIKIDKVTNTLIRAGVPNIINPNDLAAVEEALKLKDKYGGTVSIVTMGPPQAEGMLMELYGRGVDEAYLLTDRRFAGSDTLATSTILSTFLKTLPYDLILAGYQAIDGDTAQVGPQIAELLDIPQATYLSEIVKVKKEIITVKKRTEDEILTLDITMPALLTTLSDMNSPRFQSAFHIFGPEKKVHFVTFDDLVVDINSIGLAGSPTRVKTTFPKQATAKSPKEVLTPEAACKRIVNLLYPYIKENKNHE